MYVQLFYSLCQTPWLIKFDWIQDKFGILRPLTVMEFKFF